ncbi:MAG TPA: DUF1302 family protein [Myxococcota bacterium]
MAWRPGRALLVALTLALAAGAAAEEPAAAASEPEERWWEISGSVGVSTIGAYEDHHSTAGTDYQRLIELRTRLDLQIDLDLPHEWRARAAGFGFYDFAYLSNGRSRYTNEVLNSYEWEADAGEVWVEGPLLPSVDAKLGRQIVNWGRSETLRVLDVINPLDQRDPALLDLVDLRRSVGMAKLAWYPDPHWSLAGIVIPELRFDKQPPFGSDFYPFPVSFPVRKPDSFDGHAGFAAAATGVFEGWNVSFHFADLYENSPRLELSPSQPEGYRLGYSRIRMGGAGGDYAIGSFVLKGEAAYLGGTDYATVGERARFDMMLGVEYYGFADSSIALDVVNRHVFGYDGSMVGFPDFTRENNVEASLRWSADWWNARLHTTALGLLFGLKAQDGAILRFTVDYDVRDALVVGTGIQIWLAGSDEDGRLNPFAMNDRLFLRIKYSF